MAKRSPLASPQPLPAPPVAGACVADIGEHAVIDRIRLRVPPAPEWVLEGIGDDAAVIEPARGTMEVVTTDVLIEGVHFDRAYVGARDLGAKAVAVNLSDVAAMGAMPRVALLSLGLPPHLPVTDLDALIEGALEMAGLHGVSVVGGNVARSPGPLFVDVTLMGTVGRRRVLRRRGARAGDALYVSGTVGAAAAGLAWLGEHGRRTPPDDLVPCVRRFLAPEPRVRLGSRVGRNRAASAAIDLSDGLADAVRQLAAASGTGARIDGGAIPIEPGARRWFEQGGRDPVRAALEGGEDYELLLAVPERPHSRARLVRRLAGPIPLARIGRLTSEPDLILERATGDEPLPGGFTHYGAGVQG